MQNFSELNLFPVITEDFSVIADDYNSPETVMLRRRYSLAAEYLVAAELCLMGYIATLSSENSLYDLVVDSERGLRRVQVKCNGKARYINLNGNGTEYYGYTIDGCSSSSRSSIKRGDPIDTRYLGKNCDLFAFVGIDVRQILFINPLCLQKTSHAVRFRDFTEEKCALSRDVVLGCLGKPHTSKTGSAPVSGLSHWNTEVFTED